MFETVADGLFVRSDPFNPGETSFQAQGNVRLAALPDGGFIAVWNGQDGFNNSGVFAQRFNSDGTPLASSFLVNSVIAGPQVQPDVTSFPDGSFAVTWADESAYPAVFDIKVQLFDAAGIKVGEAILANSTTEGIQHHPKVTALVGGGFVVTWEDTVPTGFDNISGQVFDALGRRLGAEFIASDTKPGDKIDANITALANGGFVVSWFAFAAETNVDAFGNSSAGVRAQIFDAVGNKQSSAFALNDYVPGTQQQPATAALPDGGFVAAWADSGDAQAANKGVWIQRFDALGLRIGVAVKASSLSPQGQGDPVIEVVPDEGFLVIWKDSNATADSDVGSARAQLISFSGDKLGEEFAVTMGNVGSQNDMDLARLTDGSLVFGWTSSVAPQYDDDARIEILFRTSAGTSLGDTIKGDANRDFIDGMGGDDELFGNDGADQIAGGEGNDRILGGNGDDQLSGGTGNDFILGGAGNDRITGADGNDVIRGEDGDDQIAGGAGFDTAIYGGLWRNYSVAISNGAGTISGGVETGTDSLSGIEALQFMDGVWVDDVDGLAAQVTRLYDTVLQRAPDPTGLDLWVDELTAGRARLKDVANGFLASAEFQAKTGSLSDSDYVEFLFVNALGRASDADGKAFWVSKLLSGADRADLLIGFSESQEHRAATADMVAAGYFDTDDVYQALALLYDSFAGRQPDAAGLVFWGEAIKSGAVTLAQAAIGFVQSAEFQGRIAGMAHADLVEFMYLNTLDRAADPAGKAYWVDALDQGLSDAELLLWFSQSIEHFQLLGSSITNGIDLF